MYNRSQDTVEKLNEQDDLYTVILEGIKDGKSSEGAYRCGVRLSWD